MPEQKEDSAVKNRNPNDERDKPQQPVRNRQDERGRTDEEQGKGHGPLKGTDTQATTDLEYAEREKGKRVTM